MVLRVDATNVTHTAMKSLRNSCQLEPELSPSLAENSEKDPYLAEADQKEDTETVH